MRWMLLTSLWGRVCSSNLKACGPALSNVRMEGSGSPVVPSPSL